MPVYTFSFEGRLITAVWKVLGWRIGFKRKFAGKPFRWMVRRASTVTEV